MQDIKTEKAPKRRLAFSHTFITPLLVCAVFLLLLITETVRFDGIDMERGDAYLSLVAIQLFVFMLPSIFYIRYRSLDVREALRVRIPSPDKIMFMLLCAMILIITSILSSTLTGQLGASIYSNRYISMADTESSADTYLYYAICFALVPALCEELLFRGIVMSEYQRSSVFSAVVISSLYFAMIHFDIKNLPFFFICGLVLSMCAYAANSVIASFFVHLIYNLFAIFGGGIVDRVLSSLGQLTLIIIALGVALLTCLVLTFGECQRIYASYAKRNRESYYVVSYKKGTGALRFFSALLSPSSLVVIVMFVIASLLGG